jgi:predicted lipoprotein with Yx(FWY)xxD motif
MQDVNAHPTAWSNPRGLAFGALVASVAAAVLVGMLSGGSSAANAARSVVVKTARNSALKETILVNRRGITLYHLSVEKRGKFICTGSCLSLWHPLVVARGTTPAGARNLGTVKRPDGRLQVTYKGGPLYTFVEDRKPGDVRGNGFKDVGVWRPAVVGKAAAAQAPPTTGGGYGGGYGK